MSIVNHDLWPQLEPHLRIEVYDKDGGHDDPRIRIEFPGLPPRLAELAHEAVMPCVACGVPIRPLRHRKGSSTYHVYYAPTCPLSVKLACSRGGAAAREYERFKRLSASHPKSDRQLSLLGE